MIAQVVVNSNVKSLNKKFDYTIPKKLENKIFVGTKVLVPFGRLKDGIEAYVIDIKEESKYETKDILGILDEIPTFYIKLAKWMSKKYYCNMSDCIKLMQSPGSKNYLFESKVNEKFQKVVSLKKEVEYDAQIGRAKKQLEIIEYLKDLKENLNIDEIFLSQLEKNLNVSQSSINSLYEKGLINISDKQVQRNPLLDKQVQKDEKKVLNNEQQKAYEDISKAIDENVYCQYLINGVTGSGKTEIYLQLIEKVVSKGKTSIMLVPEISLTPQIVDRFIARFGKEKLAVIHSKLSTGERLDEWNKIRQNEAQIIIGARSALFAPVSNLGIILIDEQHDSSYKSESIPKYDTLEVANKIGENFKIPVVMGSATPLIETYYNCEHGEIKKLDLKKRANNVSLPDVEIVDMRQETNCGEDINISKKLKSEISKSLEKKEQIILFLNRRGYNTYVQCKSCGTVVKCPNCDINLTYHKKRNILKCHYCSYEEQYENKCRCCGSEGFVNSGCGTQKLEEQINLMFPNATTIRMDNDTTNVKNGHEKILSKFNKEKIDFLIGTQMVVKGHHFPNVTLVGVINADSLLNSSEYNASEKAFSQLVQVSGRAGRDEKKGKVIIQTYNPEHFVLENVKKQDYKKLYETEIATRQFLNYPPFCNIIVFNINGSNKKMTENISKNIQEFLSKVLCEKTDFKVFKYCESPIGYLQNRYRYRVLVKGKIDESSNKILNNCLNVIYKNIKNMDIRVSIDVNPENMS